MKNQNDFKPDELIKASDDHEKSLAQIQKAVAKIENRVGDSASLTISFKDAFENDKKMDTVLTGLICDLIVKDDDLKKAICRAVEKVDRKWWNGAWKRGPAIIGAIFLVVIGAFLQAQFAK